MPRPTREQFQVAIFALHNAIAYRNDTDIQMALDVLYAMTDPKWKAPSSMTQKKAGEKMAEIHEGLQKGWPKGTQ